MSFNIIKQLNADAQEESAGSTAETAAITNVPAERSDIVGIEPPVEEKVATAHDDFDWSVDKRNVTSYNADEKAKVR
jgi:small subunit ribosomal protein S1